MRALLSTKETFLTGKLFSSLCPSLKRYYIDLTELGFSMYVLSAKRGYCDSIKKEIVIPEFAVRKENSGQVGFLQWYVAHEFSHAFNFIEGNRDVHGAGFMKNLSEICPPQWIAYEMTYKPRNALCYGIQIPADIL